MSIKNQKMEPSRQAQPQQNQRAASAQSAEPQSNRNAASAQKQQAQAKARSQQNQKLAPPRQAQPQQNQRAASAQQQQQPARFQQDQRAASAQQQQQPARFQQDQRAASAQQQPARSQQNQFTAQIVVRDLQKSAKFYQKAFGFKEINEPQASQNKNNELCVMECNGLPVMLISEKASRALKGYEAQSPASQNVVSSTIITVLCSNIQKMYEQAINAGAKPIQAPHKTSAGARTFLVSGPENYVWRFIDNFSNFSQALG